MSLQRLLIKTEYFPDSINNSISRLSSYVLDYADYTSIFLQKLGYFRFRKLSVCVVGKKTPNLIIELIQSTDKADIYFCNEMKVGVPAKVLNDIKCNPNNYAIVNIECFH